MGETEIVLAELKCISCCPTRYPRDPCPSSKAVDSRAALLPNEYNLKAKKIDNKFGGVAGSGQCRPSCSRSLPSEAG